MEIICLFGLFPNEYLSQIQKDSICGIQNAANKFQWAIVKGLDSYKDLNVRIVNSLYIGSFPKKYRRKVVPTFYFSHTKGTKDINVGFLNLPLIKVISRYFGIKKHLKFYLNSSGNEKRVVLAYAMTFPFVQILGWIKKKYPDVHCCLVVPDLPEYMNASSMDKRWYKFAKKLQKIIILSNLRKVDSFVLLTEQMKEWFDRPIKYTVVEGISLAEKDEDEQLSEKENSVFYAGMIEEKYGVVDLVKSFISLNLQDWSLEIYGDGQALDQIKKMAEPYENINIHGMVPNAEVIAAQKRAEMLVNPRKNNQEFTKYSFPSKIIEYMSSGTPMLAYKLPGMPADYCPFFYKVGESENFAMALDRVLKLDAHERRNMGKKAKEFIYKEKNPHRQCEKIISLFTENHK